MNPDALRARYLELHGAGKPADDALRAELAATELPATAFLHGLPLCAWPSARFMQLRFVLDGDLEPDAREQFVAVSAERPHLRVAFVDPADLSYHTFENLIGLDDLFVPAAREPIRLTGEPLVAAETGKRSRSKRKKTSHRVRPSLLRLRAELPPTLAEVLARLDALDLYLEPRGVGRGGRRFIFHAQPLADLLTAALRKALPEPWKHGFVHVNPVFRCNRFDPGDAPFEAHLDVPFSWSARKLVSKRTLLLYLTPGRGRPALRIDGLPDIETIEVGELVLFDQQLGHEGRPFVDGPKIFLRSELIYQVANVTESPDLAALFAKACYLDANSTFLPELARWAQRNYERATQARFSGRSAPTPREEPWLHHEFAGVHFLTNGYDAFFRASDVSVVDAAALVVLEQLNPTIDGVAFRKLCPRTPLVRSASDRGWISPYLAAQPPPSEPPFTALDEDTIFPPPETSTWMHMPRSLDFDSFPDDWAGSRHRDVVDLYRRAQRWAKHRIAKAPIHMLGKQVFVSPDRFVVRGHHIHLLGRASLGPLQFAAATFLNVEDFIRVEATIDGLHPILPPLQFHEHEGLLHLTFDLFRNSWMTSHVRTRAPLPYIVDRTSGGYAFWHGAAREVVTEAALQRELAVPLHGRQDWTGDGSEE